jgi:hypothetical protein
VLDADVVPRLNNATVAALLAPTDVPPRPARSTRPIPPAISHPSHAAWRSRRRRAQASVSGAAQRAAEFVLGAVLGAVARNAPLAEALRLMAGGSGAQEAGGAQEPPGRHFLLRPTGAAGGAGAKGSGESAWDFREVPGARCGAGLAARRRAC